MRVFLLIVGLSLVVMLDFLLNWVLVDLVWNAGVVLLFFVKEAWLWLVRFFLGLHLFELIVLVLLPRIKTFFLVDIWKRVFIKGIAPIVFLDAKNRRIIAERAAFMSAVTASAARAIGAAIYTRVERWCGRHTRMVLAGALMLIVGGILYFTYGVWVLVSLLPLPRWLTRGSMKVVRLVDGVLRGTLFRIAMLLGLVRLWNVIAKIIPRQLLQHFLRARRRAVKGLIARRRQASRRLSRVRWWERLVASWLAFWNTAFDQLTRRTHRYHPSQPKEVKEP